MKCKKCGKEFKITSHGTECPSCYTLYVFDENEIIDLYEEATRDESKRKFSSAATKYKFLSYEGYTPAEYRFAECKEYGRGVKADINGAVELYRAAAKKMLPEASYALYRIMSEKRADAIDRGEALYRLRIAAELGHVKSYSALADCYRYGDIPCDDEKEIAFWYAKGAQESDPYATVQLASLYVEGVGVDKCDAHALWLLDKITDCKQTKKLARRLYRRVSADKGIIPDDITLENRAQSLFDLALEGELRAELPIAFYFLERSAELGYVRAQMRVAQCHQNGVGTKKSPSDAFIWYERASKSKNADAYLALAECYRNGAGVEQSNEKCMECYENAAELGDAKSIYILANELFDGKICSRNLPRAVKLYQRAALRGHASAVVKINEIFDAFTNIFNSAIEAQKSGDNVSAVRLYTIAAEMGHRSSACNLGYCYQNGVGCKKDLRRAVHYYTIASEDGSASAKFNLGMRYKQGGGVNVDFKKAEALLREARDSGFYEDSTLLLDEIELRRRRKRARRIYSASSAVYRRGEVEKAIRMRLEAAMMGNARAEYVLGCHFEYGDGLPVDVEKAKYYYQKAREHGFRDILLEMKVGFLREKRLLEYRD